MTRVAVVGLALSAQVTGANKGIGLGIVRALCQRFDGDVLLTARDVGRGEAAVADLKKEGLVPKFHQLNILDVESIARLAKHLKASYGGLDVLVNNAAIAYNVDSPAPLLEQVKVTLRSNFRSTLDLCRYLFPALKPKARVVHVSSSGGLDAWTKCSSSARTQLAGCKTISDLEASMDDFVSAVQSGEHVAEGWPQTDDLAYDVSKMAVNILTMLQQATFDEAAIRSDMVVNACTPGYVATSMTDHKGHLTIDQGLPSPGAGADTPVYCALLPAGTAVRGVFVRRREVVRWWNPPPPN